MTHLKQLGMPSRARVCAVALALVCWLPIGSENAIGEQIPDGTIAELEHAVNQGLSLGGRSAVAGRRALKNAARNGLALVAAEPEAPNRFRVLAVVLQCQKYLLALSGTDRNRASLFATCEALSKAPDAYAESRLEADLLLSDKKLSESEATLQERAEALVELLSRYEGTLAEAKSLLMAALIVRKLDARELENQILQTLDDRYADDPEVIDFRRKHLQVERMAVMFRGTFKRVGGGRRVFPADRLGHMSLVVFWSKDDPGVWKLLADVAVYEAHSDGDLDVFSFNVDELPDAGKSLLAEHGFDWTVMRLPGGRRNVAYGAYAQRGSVALLVNAYGFAVLTPGIQSDARGLRGETSGAFSIDRARFSEPRYLAQLQSLFIGDFLIWGENEEAGEGASSQQWKQLSDCFVLAPFRYRLSKDEALANYVTAEKLSGEMLAQEPDPAAAWRIRDRQIIALLGMWNLTCDPEHLAEAVKAAKATLADKLPARACVVSRYCLALDDIRQSGAKEVDVASPFLESLGGEKAPPLALAAAAVLAISSQSKEAYAQYRGTLLETQADNPGLYSFNTFLRDRHMQYRLLRANHTLRERRARGYIVAHGYPMPTNALPSIELRSLDGAPVTLPEATTGKLTYLFFVEPPAGGGTNNFPFAKDRNGKPTRNDGIRAVMRYAQELSESAVNQDINFVAAFLTDDADHVRFLVQTNGWNCQAMTVPGGLHNPMVRRLGILSADHFPNVFLLDRDGTIVWRCSGLLYKNTFGYPFAVLLGLKVHVEACEMEYGYSALDRDDYAVAARAFQGPFPDERPQRFAWRGPRYHGLALAYAGLKQWDKALDAIDKAIDAHKLRHFHGYGRRSRNLADWRKDAAIVKIEQPCDVICMLWATKAYMLDQLGRKEEADALRELAAKPVQQHRPDVYGQFHEKLRNIGPLAK